MCLPIISIDLFINFVFVLQCLFKEQIESLKEELEAVKTRCERVEREKSDILLRRLAAMDTGPSKTAASEVMMSFFISIFSLNTKSPCILSNY